MNAAPATQPEHVSTGQSTTRTFRCNFGDGTSCEVETGEHPPEKGKNHIRRCVWNGKPTRALLRPYIAWMHTVNQQLADEWGVSLMHVFLTRSNSAEFWIYRPGQKPLFDGEVSL